MWLWRLTESVTCTSLVVRGYASIALRRHAGFGFLTFEDEDSVQRIVQERFVQIAGKQVESLLHLVLSYVMPILNCLNVVKQSNAVHFLVRNETEIMMVIVLSMTTF